MSVRPDQPHPGRATTRYGGHLDYLDNDTALLVDFDLVPVHDPPNVCSYTPDQHWADSARALRQVFEDRDGARRRGEELAGRVRSRYRSTAVAARFVAAVAAGRGAGTYGAPLP